MTEYLYMFLNALMQVPCSKTYIISSITLITFEMINNALFIMHQNRLDQVCEMFNKFALGRNYENMIVLKLYSYGRKQINKLSQTISQQLASN